MNEHDDGLVHSHSWASEAGEPPHHSRRARARARAPRRGVAPASDHPMNAFHDDGLVHEHSWAKGA